MFWLQIFCILVILIQILLYIYRCSNTGYDSKHFLYQYSKLFFISWLSEDTVIRLYHFYSYNDSWWLFIDKVPVLVCLIWPLVILSAKEIALQLNVTQSKLQLAIFTAMIVLLDAAFIEPIATMANLWSWSEPGIFQVPLIGILGWSIFAGFVTFWHNYAILALPALHAVLLLLWWSFFKYFSFTIGINSVIIVAFIFSILISSYLIYHRKEKSVKPISLLQRLPALALFVYLLFTLDNLRLSLYCVCLGFPYLSILRISGLKNISWSVPDGW